MKLLISISAQKVGGIPREFGEILGKYRMLDVRSVGSKVFLTWIVPGTSTGGSTCLTLPFPKHVSSVTTMIDSLPYIPIIGSSRGGGGLCCFLPGCVSIKLKEIGPF